MQQHEIDVHRRSVNLLIKVEMVTLPKDGSR